MSASKIPQTIPPGRMVLGYEDFWSVPEDGNRYEVIEGELCATPAPGMRHQFVSNRLQ